ncbi:hypothetical protein Tco_0822171 [Tanacetum coccineum]|uniref:Uncharacterized protein n=1 Tax=Tanacetum coccineum TaxID=301880 RepID=A0ABQ5AHF4_9ASTR
MRLLGLRVDGRSYLLSGAIDGSEANRIIRDSKSCKVRISLNGNLLWEASVLLGRKKGCVMDTLKFTAMPFGLTNAPAVFKELMSQQRNRKLSRCGRNEMGNEPILAFPGRSRRFRSILRRAKQGFGSMLGKKEKVIVRTSQQLKVLMKDCMTNMVTVLWAVTGESKLNGSNLVHETTNKIAVIQERLEAAKLSK